MCGSGSPCHRLCLLPPHGNHQVRPTTPRNLTLLYLEHPRDFVLHSTGIAYRCPFPPASPSPATGTGIAPKMSPSSSPAPAPAEPTSPNSFVAHIRQLSEKRDKEDAERSRLLEEQILQGRAERAARRAGEPPPVLFCVLNHPPTIH